MKDTLKLIQIYIVSSKRDNIKKIAKSQGYTLTGLINKLIDDYIKKFKVEK